MADDRTGLEFKAGLLAELDRVGRDDVRVLRHAGSERFAHVFAIRAVCLAPTDTMPRSGSEPEQILTFGVN